MPGLVSLEILHFENGLRAILKPHIGPLASVAVCYGVGFRNEPEGFSGLAHLFEHLMFQGSTAFAANEHVRLVERAGGSANGATLQDHTEFFQVVPHGKLRLVLELEADRMLRLELTEERLVTQRAVVVEEIARAVHSRPFGGFPWMHLPEQIFQDWGNAHNGYGDTSSVAAGSLTACRAFRERFYSPSQAVIAVAGPNPSAVAKALADVFGSRLADRRRESPIPAGRPYRLAEDRAARPEACSGSGMSAHALGVVIDSPAADLRRYAALMLLSRLFEQDAPLGRELVTRPLGDGVTTSASVGYFGPAKAVTPDTYVCLVQSPRNENPQEVEEVVVAWLEAAAETPPQVENLAAARAAITMRYWRGQDDLEIVARTLAKDLLLFGRPSLTAELQQEVARAGAGDVRAAAAHLLSSPRGRLSRTVSVPALWTVPNPVQAAS